MTTKLPARRSRNVAKLLMHGAVDGYLQTFGANFADDEVVDALDTLKTQILNTMGDAAYDQAESDLREWRKREDVPTPTCGPNNRHSYVCRCDGRGIVPIGGGARGVKHCDCPACEGGR